MCDAAYCCSCSAWRCMPSLGVSSLDLGRPSGRSFFVSVEVFCMNTGSMQGSYEYLMFGLARQAPPAADVSTFPGASPLCPTGRPRGLPTRALVGRSLRSAKSPQAVAPNLWLHDMERRFLRGERHGDDGRHGAQGPGQAQEHLFDPADRRPSGSQDALQELLLRLRAEKKVVFDIKKGNWKRA